MGYNVLTAYKEKPQEYIPRGRNVLHTVFEKHFQDFCDVYKKNMPSSMEGSILTASWMLGNSFFPVVIT